MASADLDSRGEPGTAPVWASSRARGCSLVIPTKNGGPLFARVLDGLRSQSLWSQLEVIIVDSGSTDGTLEAAIKAGVGVYKVEPASFNHGATRDYAISLATNEVVVLMVQDALPRDDRMIERLVAAFDDPAVAGTYARQLPQPDSDVLTKRNLDRWLTGRTTREVRQSKGSDWYERLPAMERYLFCNFDNVCAAIRKSIWQQERFGRINFGEDIDWAERVLKRGYKIVYEPDAVVVHSHDRPLSYEYKRTYVCHRKLYRQFGLHLVPSLKGITPSWLHGTAKDIAYVLKHESRLRKRIELILRVPLLNWLSAYAQYRAVQDELAGQENRVRGI
jgi:rhamnosyltransferase